MGGEGERKRPSKIKAQDHFLSLFEKPEQVPECKAKKCRVERSEHELSTVKLTEMADDFLENDQFFKASHTAIRDHVFRVPLSIWNRLYKYQQEGVKWLWELHNSSCGGILGDEMGLGKTIQIIAFLAGLKLSSLANDYFKFRGLGPVLVVCPATLMWQWAKELSCWCPQLRVSSLTQNTHKTKTVMDIAERPGVLLCTYTGLLINSELLSKVYWHYVILDEGHKIRNPDSKTTIRCKMFRTPHRIIISGSPIQNNLRELWSLFDFVFPGKLGPLDRFMELFGVPIQQGGYVNATKVQVHIAYKCAIVLKNAIHSHLLRRLKAEHSEVNLPSKNEHVLFCRLTDGQMRLYEQYLATDECRSAAARDSSSSSHIFVAVAHLRKICNHPDLFTAAPENEAAAAAAVAAAAKAKEEEGFGHWERSGKMMVVKTLLDAWHLANKKVLIFSQSRKMLNILESFIQKSGYTYLRMDGATCVSSRQNLIETFNGDPSIFIFLLTTRVGGLGLNLTSASRVVIYDPDWNPSIDTQARERVWRIGQRKDVTIYRLVSTGSIEEKIFHRQVYKQFLVEKVLMNPKQRRFFKFNDLHDLFSLGSKDSFHPADCRTETEELLSGSVKCIRSTNTTTTTTIPKKPKRNAEIDGVSIPFLDQYETTDAAYLRTDDENDDDDDHATENTDNYLLGQLFKMQTVQCALEHDSIINSDDIDHALIEMEAETYAKEAVKELVDSRRHCFSALSGIPNASTRSMMAHNGSKRILAGIRERAALVFHLLLSTWGGLCGTKGRELTQGQCSKNSTLLKEMIAFIKHQRNAATTNELIERFQHRIQSQAIFKSLLKSIACLDKRTGDDKLRKWRLLTNFR